MRMFQVRADTIAEVRKQSQHYKYAKTLARTTFRKEQDLCRPLREGTGVVLDGLGIRVFLKSGTLGDKSSDVRDLGPEREILLDRKCHP